MSRETSCRICRSSKLRPILDLGSTTLANRLLTKEQLAEPEPHFPLELVFCEDCTLLQITETVPPEELFRDYVYFSSFSDTVVQNARENATRQIAARQLGRDDLVVEIASNDGYLLQFYRDAGVPVLGIEPAQNIAAEAVRKGIDTLPEFFGTDLGRRLAAEGKKASVVHAHNVLAHVADLNGFVAGIREILRAAGVAIIEVPYARDLIEGREFDTIYHEHLCYFSTTALQRLFARHQLALADVERIPIHGGSLRLTVGMAGTAAEPRVAEILAAERAWGVARTSTYLDFAGEVSRLRDDLLRLLRELRAAGHTIAAYGASAKGSTLLSYCGIGSDLLDFVVDRSTVKQGLFTPGTHLEILPPEALEKRRPDFLLLLTWNHAAEILDQQRAYRERGGSFIVPVPAPRIVR